MRGPQCVKKNLPDDQDHFATHKYGDKEITEKCGYIPKYKTYNMLLYTNDGHENVMLSLSEFHSITLCCYAFVRK